MPSVTVRSMIDPLLMAVLLSNVYTNLGDPSSCLLPVPVPNTGDLTPVAFLSQLEKLFGEGQLEAVVIPLVTLLSPITLLYLRHSYTIQTLVFYVHFKLNQTPFLIYIYHYW